MGKATTALESKQRRKAGRILGAREKLGPGGLFIERGYVRSENLANVDGPHE